jgi:hypothetical protein
VHIGRLASGPPAFNVRFGVEFGGVRFPYRLRPEDPQGGNYQRVLQSGTRQPREGDQSFPIPISSEDMWAAATSSVSARARLDDGRLYWCRYENARRSPA